MVGLRDGEGKAVGYVVAGPCDLPVPDMPARSGEVVRFYVLSRYQGAGLGRRMLDVALGWLDENFDHVYLSVWSENKGAHRLYARCGFAKIAEYEFEVGAHRDREWIMKRFPQPREET